MNRIQQPILEFSCTTLLLKSTLFLSETLRFKAGSSNLNNQPANLGVTDPSAEQSLFSLTIRMFVVVVTPPRMLSQEKGVGLRAEHV